MSGLSVFSNEPFTRLIGNNTLSWEELSEVVLDVEVALNNQPLSYIEDDVELPVLTPNSMLNINPSVLPELKPYHIDNRDLRKRAKFMIKCKESVWKRWSREYVKSLRERSREWGRQADHHPTGYQFMFRTRMYRSLIPVFKSVKDQRTAHSCAKHKLITTPR